MNLPIAKYGDPILRAQGRRVEKVNDHIRELAANMVETMHAANGVGLAAQQVGEALQLTVLDVLQTEDRPSTLRLNGREIELLMAMPLILLNPKIALDDETNISTEGCLSFPEITAEIERSVAVNVLAETLEGEPIEIEATGLLARVLQHEVDHLNGILFIDRMSSVAKATLQSRLKRLRKETLRGEKNAARASQINL
jgi:peptide deformylase